MVLIMSWNVAGLSSTIHRINESYKIPTNTSLLSSKDSSNNNTNAITTTTITNSSSGLKRKRNNNTSPSTAATASAVLSPLPSSSIPTVINHPPKFTNKKQHPSANVCNYFYNLHKADIICLQEHKISKTTLSNRAEPYNCSTLQLYDNSTNTIIQYESFWSCCTNTKFRGFNGVVTFVRKDSSCLPIVQVLKANGITPLNQTELDNQGRCVITYHNTFILYNVYVPNTSGQSLTYKMKFLNALQHSMNTNRTIHKKPIILVGDLNIAHQPIDCHWEDQCISINTILNVVQKYNDYTNSNMKKSINDTDDSTSINSTQSQEDSNTNTTTATTTTTNTTASIYQPLPQQTPEQWMIDIATHWEYIEHVLQTKEVIETQTTNPRTNEKFIKYRLLVTTTNPDRIISTDISSNNINGTGTTVDNTSTSASPIQDYTPKQQQKESLSNNKNTNSTTRTKRIYLGSHEQDPKYCLHNYTFTSSTYYDSDKEEYVVARSANIVPIGILIELLSKICNINWDQSTRQSIINSSIVDPISPTRLWLSSILDQKQQKQQENNGDGNDNNNSNINITGMIDTFRYYYPSAQGRYTCWNQYTNQRYSNVGCRIDYILIDKALLPCLRPGQIQQEKESDGHCTNNSSTSCIVMNELPVIDESFDTISFLRCGCTTTTTTNSSKQCKNSTNVNSVECALCAATANGQYQPAAFEGGGICIAPQHVLDTQFGTGTNQQQHTGMIYTPPTFSDHIAISALFSDDDMIKLYHNQLRKQKQQQDSDTNTSSSITLELDTFDPATKKSQPHKNQTSISSFFQQQQQPPSDIQPNITSSISSTIDDAISSTTTDKLTTATLPSTNNGYEPVVQQKGAKAINTSCTTNLVGRNKDNNATTRTSITGRKIQQKTKKQISKKSNKDNDGIQTLHNFFKSSN